MEIFNIIYFSIFIGELNIANTLRYITPYNNDVILVSLPPYTVPDCFDGFLNSLH